MFRTLIRTGLVIVASAVCLAPAQAAKLPAPPHLSGRAFTGTYDRGGPEGFNVTVLLQKGRRLVKVQVDAMNESQFRLAGRISKDNLTFKAKGHTSGKKKFWHVLTLTGNVVGGGTSLNGTYTLAFPSGTPTTGTFSVSR
jgi:hypothetical protein